MSGWLRRRRDYREALAYVEKVERAFPMLPKYPRSALRADPRAAVENTLAAVRAISAGLNGASADEACAVFEEHLSRPGMTA